MKPDRVWAWAKRAIKGKNIYLPQDMCKLMNTVKSIDAEFLDNKSEKPVFVTGWSDLLCRYFDTLPDGYTGNYFFEFENGMATVRHLCTTSDEEAWSFQMCTNPEQVKKALLHDLFAVSDPDLAVYANIRLPKDPGLELKLKKVVSLSNKYHSIPADKMWFYP